MATINNKLIHFKSKSDFDGRYAATTDGGRTYGDFLGTSIVFIQDAKQIWTHGQFYDANEATLASLGITVTAAELNYMDGVTSNVQTQLNEIKESVDSISDPYEINLTNLLSAEDSESISTAIGGIDNLNATVQDNRIIVGTISNGSVSVSIRILGNVTTLYYLLDSVLGLTLNEIAITNTSGTLSKNVTTHSVLTENMVINSLTSNETTLPLSAAQGKTLDNKITTLQTNLNTKQNSTDNNLTTTDKTIVGAINEILPKATGVGKVDPNSNGTGEVFNCYEDFEDYYANVASGDYSHAEGTTTNASGNISHAEGYNTNASGNISHAEGSNTTASGTYSHAEGAGSNALGYGSHAEGSNTIATGDHSHTEGFYTQNFSTGEHAEGFFNKSYDSDNASIRVIHSVGIGSGEAKRKNAHEIKFNGDHYVYGLGGYDGTNAIEDTTKTLQEVVNGKQDTLVSGTSIKTINGESLLGSGDIEITVTPDLSDYQTKSDDTLNTTNKTVVGAINEIENRTLNLSTQYPSDGATLTVGTSNEPLTRIDWDVSEPAFELKGPSVLASPNSPLKYRFALGDPKSTWTEYITLQNQTDDSLQTTNKTIVGAINEILPKATGVGKIDPNSDGTGEVFNSYDGSYANKATGIQSHAEGYKTTASGEYSHAEGRGTEATGWGAHAEGDTTRANGFCSHAEGNDTMASGRSSHAEGYQGAASGKGAHIEGGQGRAEGDYSHAEGFRTETFSESEHAEGRYNKSYNLSGDPYTRVIHSVGIGSGDNDRKNAHEIKFNGDHYIYGLGGYDGTETVTAQTLQEVVNSKQATITAGTGLEFEGTTLNVTLDTTVFKVVSVLPDSPAQGDENKIHLVPAESTGANNAYTEYVWVNSAWEILGEYTSEVDLTPYLKTADAANTYLSKTDAASTYLSKTDATSTYLNKTDASSTYLSKTDAASTYQPVGDYATSTELTEGLAGKQDAGSYATTTQLEALQTEVDSKADSTKLPTYTTVPELAADYNIPANATTVEKVYDITVGATLYNITYADGIKWVNDVAPITRANHRYVVSIINNLGVWGEF